MNARTIGSNDSPISRAEDDALGFQVYVDALGDFIASCETPMTVAVQGDWGSGKTSLMNLIRERVVASSDRRTRCLWINTWQFSQFDLGADLPLAVIDVFTRSFAADPSIVWKVLKSLSDISIVRAARTTLMSAALVSTAAYAGKDSAEAVANTMRSSDADSGNLIARLMEMRENLQRLIAKTSEKEGVDRFVVFIDDIDRLVPERAVDLLEAMKVFLDLDSCVFVLACDYQVVSRGLRSKFGADSSDLKGRHFFDKIIQLPFSMPVGQIEISRYLRDRLRSCGVDLTSDDSKQLSLYEGLLAHSVGFNPRSLKRLTNCLQVLRSVAETKRVLDGTEREGTRAERERALFAALCMQTAYEPLYVALMDVTTARGVDVAVVLSHLGETESSTESTLPDRVRSKLDSAVKECDLQKPGASSEIPLFLDAVRDAIQIQSGASGDVDPEEAAMFLSMLRFSSITATSSAVQEQTRRADLSGAVPVVGDLQKWLREKLDCHTRWWDGAEGVWTAPIIRALGFDVYFGVNREGALCISVDLATEDKSKIPRARENARKWCGEFFKSIGIPYSERKGNVSYGFVFAVLEPEGFSARPEVEMKAVLLDHGERVMVPLVRHLQKCLGR
ncbi:MAG: hypothetical protein IT467_12410 [Dokdonella sp.]|nr:hypothetical protein [Dokdonella sp.]